VTDSAGNSATATCPIIVNANPVNLECSICGSNKATVGTPYSVTLNATGGTGSYTYSLVSGSLPAGLSLSSKGVISGTPTSAGTYTFSIKATDTSGAYDTATCTIVVVNSPINLNCGSCGSGKAYLGAAYTSNFTVSGGTGPYVYSIVSGSLPAGLTLNTTTGAVTGKPTTAGVYTFTAKVVDTKTNYTDTATCSITVAGIPVNLECGICGTGNAKVGTSYSSKLAVSGGTGSFTYSIVAGSLPPGLSLNSSTGVISGTPISPGSYTFTSKVLDATGTSDTAMCTIVVTGTPVNLDCGLCKVGKVVTGVAFSSQLSVTGGAAPYTFSIASGSLPPGLKLDTTTGKITGTPTTPGTYNFTARVTDKYGNSDTDSCTLTVSGVVLDIQCGACSGNNATVGTAYATTLAATGGYPGYTFSIVSGSLPAGLTLSSSGAISGTPTTAGNKTFTAKVTDSRGNTDTVTCTIAVAASPLDLECGTCGASKATIGAKYSVTMKTTGGTGTLSFAVTSGSLPAGLTMSSSGVISGTPAANSAGTYTFTTTVTDANHKTDTAVCTITVSKC
jgi:Zn finger protein HypA/HybF involved in hydrogenase expression